MDDSIFPEPSQFDPTRLRIQLQFHLTTSFHSEGDLGYVQDTTLQGLKPLFQFTIWLLGSLGSYMFRQLFQQASNACSNYRPTSSNQAQKSLIFACFKETCKFSVADQMMRNFYSVKGLSRPVKYSKTLRIIIPN
ncbi:uncharacterized protein LOC111275692 [Durio zibethinus]|uniref:Uncharacterized protein LOC111275692 n=1 Tax=Durio zibethinus TaxID=66656 RepID=A0A6P5WMA9_DURZI|nr:uncharacterized protein LOC111275692 [Durio zibethinus]